MGVGGCGCVWVGEWVGGCGAGEGGGACLPVRHFRICWMSLLHIAASLLKSKIRNAYVAFRSQGARSLNTENMSRKSSKCSPRLPVENTSHMRSLKGFSLSSGRSCTSVKLRRVATLARLGLILSGLRALKRL